jgi:hypothetical protein
MLQGPPARGSRSQPLAARFDGSTESMVARVDTRDGVSARGRSSDENGESACLLTHYDRVWCDVSES